MKVLSIDFDYFQKVSKETLERYPDGIDQPTEISEMIWGCRYSDEHSAADLLKVSIINDEFEKMKDILKYQKTNIPVMIANSHKHIYDFIHSNTPVGNKLFVANVDMHHDIFNDNDKVDCGNWLRFIRQEYGANFMWICNPVSKDVYGFTNEAVSGKKKTLSELLPESLDILSERKFDMVFLCRSDIWTPPHLDNKFTELCDVMKKHFDEIMIENGITQPRTYKKYVNILDDIKRKGKELYGHE